VAAAITLSILLAVAIALRPAPLVLAVAGAFGLISAFVDTLEILHQVQEHRQPIAAIAAVAALCHLTITVLAIILMRRPSVRHPLAS
jgi:hypothetical protein